ncbi:MAG: GC-type dockerin domain-anchored protein [Planctomycetota bacterium]
MPIKVIRLARVVVIASLSLVGVSQAVAQADSDNDGVPDDMDVCPGGNDLLDSDSDGIPNACDPCPGFEAIGYGTSQAGAPDAGSLTFFTGLLFRQRFTAIADGTVARVVFPKIRAVGGDADLRIELRDGSNVTLAEATVMPGATLGELPASLATGPILIQGDEYAIIISRSGGDIGSTIEVPVRGLDTGILPLENSIDDISYVVSGSVHLPVTVEYASPFCSIDLTTTGATLPGAECFSEPDGMIDLDDLGIFIILWLASDPIADFTTTGATLPEAEGFAIPDGMVDLDDLGFYITAWLTGCP